MERDLDIWKKYYIRKIEKNRICASFRGRRIDFKLFLTKLEKNDRIMPNYGELNKNKGKLVEMQGRKARSLK